MASRVEPGPLPFPPDPLAPVLELGRRELRVGAWIGLMGALVLHGAGVYRAATLLLALGDFAAQVQAVVIERQRAMVDIDAREIEKPTPELDAPPDKPEPSAIPRPANPTPAKEAPPAAAAEAGKVLTQEPSDDEPLDMTDTTFVSGESDRYAGGTTASDGTSKTAVVDPRAKGGGTDGGTGKTPGAKPAAGAVAGGDKGRPATPASRSWNCGFPPEADFDQIDFATVMISVTVGPDGRAKSVNVLSDPGHGFGRLAKSCAMRMQYNPGYDKDGQPITKTTSPFPVRFTR
jgi:protein TonB